MGLESNNRIMIIVAIFFLGLFYSKASIQNKIRPFLISPLPTITASKSQNSTILLFCPIKVNMKTISSLFLRYE